MNNKTKLFIVLAITGWLRVLIIAIPITLTYFGVINTDASTPTKQVE